MGEVLKHKGGNDFKIPHIGKERLARQGLLPKNIGVSNAVYEAAVELSEVNNYGTK